MFAATCCHARQPLPLNAFALVSSLSLHLWQCVASQPWCHACNVQQCSLLTTVTAATPCFADRVVFNPAQCLRRSSWLCRCTTALTSLSQRMSAGRSSRQQTRRAASCSSCWPSGKVGAGLGFGGVQGVSGQGMQDWVGTTDGVEGWQLHPIVPCFGNLQCFLNGAQAHLSP